MAIKRTSKFLGIGRKRILIPVVACAVLIVVLILFLQMVKRPVIDLKGKQYEYLYIPTNSDFDDVKQLLLISGWLTDDHAFTVMSQMMNYIGRVKSGRYKIADGMTSRELIRRLRSGEQAPVNVTFNNIRTLPQLAGIVADDIEADSAALVQAMSDTAFIARHGFTPETLPAMFIPNTYQFMWDTDGQEWMDRMLREYNAFWNEHRRHKADSIGLSPIEVSTLASIIEEESKKTDEQPIIAGLYLNRLRMGMPMQACPTIKFALGDFTIRRVLKRDQEVESPYNTYKHAGLPPGPIRIPSITVIDAVLNAAEHKYLFMCAKPDGSGYHDFARTNAEHSRNAARYQQLLNKKKIYR